jgi:arylsulfatase
VDRGDRSDRLGSEAADDRPNILLIVADDLGYADLGSYGSDIATPHLDRLAARGLRFSQFHTAPMCAPSRAMLLTGNDNHVAGMGDQDGGSGPTEGLPGYEGHLSDRVLPFPLLLRDAGYATSIAGKWHLGEEPEHSPTAAGFERSFTLLQGAGDHYSDVALETASGVSRYWEDGEYAGWPEGRYDTQVYTDRLMEFIDDGLESGRPFMAVAAYTAPHWPLQVPEGFRHRYAGRYDMGYERLRELRLESLKGAGIVPETWTAPPHGKEIRPWDSLTQEEQRVEARKMELYAAMVENLDHHVGRLLDHLERRGELENTLVIFLSDNGAAGEDFFNTGPFVDWLRSRYDNRYETMGGPESYVSYGPQWAVAGAAPFRGHKADGAQGGIVTPMIVAGPGVGRAGVGGDGAAVVGGVVHAYVGIQDLAPTLLEVAGTGYPGPRGSPRTRPMTGRSILPLLSGETDRIHPEDEVLALSHRGRTFVRRGNWKLLADADPFDPAAFRLYDLSRDPGETLDRSGDRTDIREELFGEWERFRDRVGVWTPPTTTSNR